MLAFFTSPWVMAMGGLLIAAPVIIHLINRMRFRRIQWAAMEFLLKAQKKMRRKKILEQLLLLLLRMLLLFLFGLLLARYLGDDPTQGKETRPVLHVVVLDDSPSMADTGDAAAGPNNDAFSRARSQITEKLLPAALKASTPQALRLIRLSDGADLVNTGTDSNKAPEQINNRLVDQVRSILAQQKPTTVRLSLVPGLQRAKELLQRSTGGDVAKVVHVVSDMRSLDWTRDAEAISQAVKELTDMQVKVHLIDVASPNRKADRKSPAYSDNVGILELKPRNKIAATDKEVEFEIRVKNYGSTDLKNVRVEFYLNAHPNVITSIGFETLPAGQERTQVFLVTFSTNTGATVSTREDPLARFNVITAKLENIAADSLAADNVRYAVVEVREKLSVLLVSRGGEFDKPDDKNGDSFYLQRLFEIKFSGIEVVTGGIDSLDKLDLREFSSVYLVNIPSLTEAQVKNLERYARDGGGVGVFLGKAVTPTVYNNQFYRKGDGLFPFPLPDTGPTPPLTDEQKFKRLASLSKRLLVRDPAVKTHPALQGIYTNERGVAAKDNDVERYFYFAGIDHYWKIERIGRWREDRTINELYCLPNEEPTSEFEARVVRLGDAIRSKYGEPKFEKFRPAVDAILNKMRALAGDPENPPLTELARQLDRLLSDQISEGDANEALLREFWGNPELAEVKTTAQALRDSTKFGAPLYVARRFGNGRFAVMTIDVGGGYKDEAGVERHMTDWPSGPGSAGWVAVMTEMQKFLAGGGSEENRVSGVPLELNYEEGRYKPEVTWSFLNYDPANPDKVTRQIPAVRDPVQGQPPKTAALDLRDKALRLNFADNKRAGVYLFSLTRLKAAGDPADAPSNKPEYAATVFNFDTEREGDLKRANTDDFKSVARGAEDVHSPEDDGWLGVLEQKPTDLSSGRWIYLVILIVLIFEQAMAVRLSYHQRPDEVEAFAPSAAAAMAGRTAVPTSDADAAPAAGEGPAS